MSKVCQITGKKAITGNNVSHSKRRTKRKFNVNVFNRKFFWPEQGQWIRLTVSASGLRNINKMGLDAALKKAAEEGHLTSAPSRRVLAFPASAVTSRPRTARTPPSVWSSRNTTPI